ncbi:MAG: ATP-binding protein [Pseudomonadota bacterium]
MLKNKNTISSKLSSLIWLTSGSALLVAAIGLTLYDILSYKTLLLKDITTKTELVGQSASAALQFTDAAAAHEIISIFQADTAVLYASLHDRSGSRLATYQTTNASVAFPEILALDDISQTMQLRHVDFSRPITYEGETVGGLFIRYSLAPFYAKQLRHLLIVAFVLLLASLVIVLISPRLKREITQPILKLVATSRSISEQKDYALRVTHQTSPGNELAVLTTAFNEMLSQIEKRDRSIADHRDHLEQLVDERTSELSRANVDLEHARELAEEANEFKSLILDNLTHEFRTPLNGIMGITAILRDESPADLLEFIDMIESSGQRLFSLLTSLLNLASLEKQSLVFSNAQLEVEAVLIEILPPFHALAEENGLEFEIDVASFEETVPFDPSAFKLLLEPLLSNAFKFTSSGKITLSIQITMQTLHLIVEDTGQGIDPAFISNMFEPFSQESNGLTRMHEGAGIGLAIVKRITDMLEGSIEVASKQGEGTSIQLTYPLAPLLETPKEPSLVTAK